MNAKEDNVFEGAPRPAVWMVAGTAAFGGAARPSGHYPRGRIVTYTITTTRPGATTVVVRSPTLEDANSTVYDIIAGSCIADDGPARLRIQRFDEYGGTIGPLPDGLLIRVERDG